MCSPQSAPGSVSLFVERGGSGGGGNSGTRRNNEAIAFPPRAFVAACAALAILRANVALGDFVTEAREGHSACSPITRRSSIAVCIKSLPRLPLQTPIAVAILQVLPIPADSSAPSLSSLDELLSRAAAFRARSAAELSHERPGLRATARPIRLHPGPGGPRCVAHNSVTTSSRTGVLPKKPVWLPVNQPLVKPLTRGRHSR